jgi:hypothetical protein
LKCVIWLSKNNKKLEKINKKNPKESMWGEGRGRVRVQILVEMYLQFVPIDMDCAKF